MKNTPEKSRETSVYIFRGRATLWFLNPSEFAFLKEERLVQLQEAMETKMGLEVYKCRAGTPGNSNSGNTSRVAFGDPKTFANILELPEEFVEDLAELLNAYNSKDNVSSKGFQELAQLWLKRVQTDEKYKWNWPPSSIHAMLKHGHRFIEAYPTPPGYWTEEGGEHNHKLEKLRREHHARKTNIDSNLDDIVTLQNCSSDPVIQRILQKSLLPLRKRSKKSKEGISLRLKNLLYPAPADEMEIDSQDESGLGMDQSQTDFEEDSDYEVEAEWESDNEYFVEIE